jgi:hypothetical protein
MSGVMGLIFIHFLPFPRSAQLIQHFIYYLSQAGVSAKTLSAPTNSKPSVMCVRAELGCRDKFQVQWEEKGQQQSVAQCRNMWSEAKESAEGAAGGVRRIIAGHARAKANEKAPSSSTTLCSISGINWQAEMLCIVNIVRFALSSLSSWVKSSSTRGFGRKSTFAHFAASISLPRERKSASLSLRVETQTSAQIPNTQKRKADQIVYCVFTEKSVSELSDTWAWKHLLTFTPSMKFEMCTFVFYAVQTIEKNLVVEQTKL